MIGELARFLGSPIVEWMPKMTLIFLLGFRPWRQYEPPRSRPSMVGKVYLALLLTGLLFPALPSSPAYWFLVAALHFLWIALAYAFADNHRYLEGYWILALAVALSSGDKASELLAWDARLLIGLCFLLAALWKILQLRYRDGSFFTHSLLFEPRFLPIALWVGGLSPGVQLRHREAKGRLLSGRSNSERAPVPARLRRTALTLAWWTIGVETLLAVLFLAPWPGMDLARVLGLALFVLSAYAVTPVPTFGYILLLMLMAAVESTDMRLWVLGLAAALLPLTELAHFLEKLAVRRMAQRWRAASAPLFSWTSRAGSRRLEKDSASSWRLAFPSVGVSLYAKSEWTEGLQRMLEVEKAFTWKELVGMASGIPGPELQELVGMLTRMRLLSYSSPLEGKR